MNFEQRGKAFFESRGISTHTRHIERSVQDTKRRITVVQTEVYQVRVPHNITAEELRRQAMLQRAPKEAVEAWVKQTGRKRVYRRVQRGISAGIGKRSSPIEEVIVKEREKRLCRSAYPREILTLKGRKTSQQKFTERAGNVTNNDTTGSCPRGVSSPTLAQTEKKVPKTILSLTDLDVISNDSVVRMEVGDAPT
jgi:hypothetical protein